jgi:hypothetical protein
VGEAVSASSDSGRGPSALVAGCITPTPTFCSVLGWLISSWGAHFPYHGAYSHTDPLTGYLLQVFTLEPFLKGSGRNPPQSPTGMPSLHRSKA